MSHTSSNNKKVMGDGFSNNILDIGLKSPPIQIPSPEDVYDDERRGIKKKKKFVTPIKFFFHKGSKRHKSTPMFDISKPHMKKKET